MFYEAKIKSLNTDDKGNIVSCNVVTSEFAEPNEDNPTVFPCKLVTIPGIQIKYSVNDILYVGFYNNDMGQPIAIGYPISKATANDKISIRCSTLKAVGEVSLPESTKIGDKKITDINRESSTKSFEQIIQKIKANFK